MIQARVVQIDPVQNLQNIL